MKILSFDLELNQDPKGEKIIEIGASIGDISSGEIVDQCHRQCYQHIQYLKCAAEKIRALNFPPTLILVKEFFVN